MNGAEQARGVLSAAHIIYIPLSVLVGLFIGWLLGARGARAEIARLRRLLETHEQSATEERLAKLEREDR